MYLARRARRGFIILILIIFQHIFSLLLSTYTHLASYNGKYLWNDTVNQ